MVIILTKYRENATATVPVIPTRARTGKVPREVEVVIT
jgi:hypothetical protein